MSPLIPVRLATSTGVIEAQAVAVVGGLALIEDGECWNITHVRTGLAVALFPSRASGLAALGRLAVLTDWTVTARKLRSAMYGIAAGVLVVIDEHGGESAARVRPDSSCRTFRDLREDA